MFSQHSKLKCWTTDAPALGVGDCLGPLTVKIELRLHCVAGVVKERFLK